MSAILKTGPFKRIVQVRLKPKTTDDWIPGTLTIGHYLDYRDNQWYELPFFVSQNGFPPRDLSNPYVVGNAGEWKVGVESFNAGPAGTPGNWGFNGCDRGLWTSVVQDSVFTCTYGSTSPPTRSLYELGVAIIWPGSLTYWQTTREKFYGQSARAKLYGGGCSWGFGR